MTKNDETIAHLADDLSIRDALARFGLAVTVGDVDSLRDLWADESVWTIGAPANLTASGLDNIEQMYRQMGEGNEYFLQSSAPAAIEIDGDTASARSLCQEFAMGPNGRYYRTNGIWNDKLQRTGAGWKFTSRTWQYLWLDYSPYSGETFAVDA